MGLVQPYNPFFQVPVQCERFCIIPVAVPVAVPVPDPVPDQASVNTLIKVPSHGTTVTANYVTNLEAAHPAAKAVSISSSFLDNLAKYYIGAPGGMAPPPKGIQDPLQYQCQIHDFSDRASHIFKNPYV